MSTDSLEQRRIIEALVVASAEPISAARLAQIVPDCTPATAKELVNSLNAEYQKSDRSFEIWEVAGGYQMRTRAEFSGYLQQLQKQRPLRLSGAALDTLAVVAFKQPVTRSEIESIRGVDSGAVIKGLLERRLLRIAGHRDVPGRPLVYGTTRRFLEVFGLASLDELPSLRELEELTSHRADVVEDGADTAGTADTPMPEGETTATDVSSDGRDGGFAPKPAETSADTESATRDATPDRAG